MPLFKVADPPEREATKSDTSRSPLPDEVLNTSLPKVTLILLLASVSIEDTPLAWLDIYRSLYLRVVI